MKRLLQHPKRIIKLALRRIDTTNAPEDVSLQRVPLGMDPTHNRKPFLQPR
eukprot:CAMPEP_0173425148 /NCGR_PEP_ID=MMETSP1357-20121228/4937_1 /TAXON_ID=77926 /ORGANISM="Hemiselmis rufescens, Strain PCC563" /LENGTH=50 /DNA_ID=CAMNT_0014388539 /DNA_START=135 /DNA_END=284 /DNA_ORIENTATION=-